MSHYAHIFDQIWKDKKFRQLDDSGQKLFIALITSPSSNMIGYYNCALAYILHDLGWDETKFRKNMSDLEKLELAYYDYNSEVAFVRNFLKYNKVETIKQVVGAYSQAKSVPPSYLFLRFYQAWKTFAEDLYKANTAERLAEAKDEAKTNQIHRAIAELNRISKGMQKILHDTEISTIDTPNDILINTPTDTPNDILINTPTDTPIAREVIHNAYTPIDTPNDKGTDIQQQQQQQQQKQKLKDPPSFPPGEFREGETPSQAEATVEDCGKDMHPSGIAEDDEGASPAQGQLFDGPDVALREKAKGTLGPPLCPHEAVIALYHEILPELPKVRDWGKNARAQLGARWNENVERQSLGWWREYFESIRSMNWLMGRVPSKDGQEPFKADMLWLVGVKNMDKVFSGRYLRGKSSDMPPSARSPKPQSLEDYMREMGDDPLGLHKDAKGGVEIL
jgi:hypothetical protein